MSDHCYSKLLTLLCANGDESVSVAVEDQLARAETHVRKAVGSMTTQVPLLTREVSPTIPWLAASRSEDRQNQGACLTLQEKGDILSRARKVRKLNSE